MKLFKFISILCFALAGFAFSQAAGGDVPLFSLSSSSVNDGSGPSMKFSITQQDELGTPSETGCSVDLDWKRLAECITREVEISIGSASSNAVELETSLNLGGFDAATGKCVYDLEPLTFGGMIPNFNGNGHTITGFCYTADGSTRGSNDAGFFGNLSGVGGVLVSDVTFDNAYVAVKNSTGNSAAGVVAARVGYDAFFKNVKVVNSTASAFYAGSVIGEAANVKFEGVTVSSSSVLFGSDNGNGSAVAVAPKAYLGGLIGFLHVESYAEEMNLENFDVDGGIVKNTDYTANVSLGGVVGYIDFANTLYIHGSVKADIQGGSYMGGVVGQAIANEYVKGMYLEISDVKFNGSVRNSCASTSYMGGIVGYVNNARLTLMQNTVEASVVENSSAACGEGVAPAEIYIGGVVGAVYNSETDLNYSIDHNSVVGYLAAPSASKSFVGYLMGSQISTDFDNKYANGNYFYEISEELPNMKNAVLGVASMTEDEWIVGADYYMCNNFRNATAEVAATGDFVNFRKGGIALADGSYARNGVIDEQDMKTPMFAASMNGNQYWSYEDGKNGNLPYPSTEYEAPIRTVTIDFKDVYGQLSSEDLDNLKKIGNLEFVYIDDALDAALLKIYTDNKGLLNAEDVEVLQNLSKSLFYAQNDVPKSLAEVFTEPNTELSAGVSKTYKVKYLYREYAAGDLDNFNDADFDNGSNVAFEEWEAYSPIFLRNRVDSFSTNQFDVLLPKVVAVSNDGKNTLQKLRIARICAVGVEYGMPGVAPAPICYSGPITENFVEDSPLTFISWFDQIEMESDVVYFIYRKSDDFIPVTLESSDEIPLVFKAFGSTMDDRVTVVENVMLDSYNSYKYSEALFAADFLPEAATGYRMTGYTATVALRSGASAAPIEVNRPDLGSVEELTETIKGAIEASATARIPPDVSWQVSLGAEDTLHLQNLLHAASKAGGRTDGSFEVKDAKISVVPEYEAIPYKVDFSLEGTPDNTFLVGDWDAEEYSLESDRRVFPSLASNRGCFMGWGASITRDRLWNEMTLELLNRVDVVDETFPLYSQWENLGAETCETISTVVLTRKLESENGAPDGEISLWQSYKNSKGEEITVQHPFKDDGTLWIPFVSDPVKFHVSAKSAEGYKLARLILKDWNTDEGETADDVEGEIIPLNENDTTFTTVFEEYHGYSLNAVFKPYIDVTLDLNTSSDKVLYGENSRMKKVSVMDVDDEVVLPSWIYTADSCVLGWSVQPDAKDYEYRTMTYGDEIYRNTLEGRKLYAVWGSTEQCVGQGGYDILWLDAEKDYLQFEETLTEGDSELVQMHRFSANGTMILPRHTNGHSFILRSIPGSEFVVDSVLFVRKESGESAVFARDENFSFYYLYDGVFTPYYSVAKDTVPEDTIPDIELPSDSGSVVIGTPAMAMNGAAAQVKVPTDLKKDQEFEVYVVVINAAGDTIKETTQSGVVKNAPHVAEVMVYPLPAGKYNVVVSVRSENGVAYKKTQLVVDPIVIATKKDEWQMVSLAAVDMDAISWDGDELFYWWDEYANYGDFWQYQKLTRLGEVEYTRGYWYNSLEGRQLPLMSIGESVPEAEWKLDSVYSGWNMVANPYGWRVNVPDSLEVAVWDDEISNYVYPNTLEPYQAAWVYANGPREVALKDTPVFAMDSAAGIAAKRRALAKARNAGDWAIRAELSDVSGHKDTWNVLGVGEACELSEPPMGMGESVSFGIVEGKRLLAKAIKAAPNSSKDISDAYEWKVALSASSDRFGYLKFDGLRELAAFGYHLYVTVDGSTSELLADDSLRVMLKAAGTTATVQVTRNVRVAAADMLKNLRAIPLGNQLSVSFDVAGMASSIKARATLMDLKGNIVSAVNVTVADGRNQLNMAAPRCGVYMLQVSAAGKSATAKVVVK